MQGNNGLLAKPFKKFPKSPIYTASGFSVLTSAKFAVLAVACLNKHKLLINYVYFIFKLNGCVICHFSSPLKRAVFF